MTNKQKGFSLVMAIFILVVLALLGSYMVRLSGTQATTMVYALQGARAYQAARAGIAWSVSKINSDNNCIAVNAAALTFPDLNGFTVTMTCNSQSYTEVTNIDVYTLSATSTFGSYSDRDHVYRNLEVTLMQ